jgi:NitT/TauT family transport system permease protein
VAAGVTALEKDTPIAAAFAPLEAARPAALLEGPDIWRDIGLSLRRVAWAWRLRR